MNTATAHAQIVSRGMRAILLLASALVLIAGFQLFILTEHTERYFAWTVRPPLTAAFLGASYWASLVLVFAAARQRYWVNARASAFSALTFTSLTTVATLLHLDRFHFDASTTITLVANWAWMLVYWFVPPILGIILILQMQKPGQDLARELPLPRWLWVALGSQGAVMLVMGAALFLYPKQAASFWPWPLTALNARAVGAWLLGMGVAAAAVLLENDRRRVRGPLLCYGVLGALHLLALGRYANARLADSGSPVVDWSDISAWLYLTFVCSVLVVGTLGWISSLRATRR
jgi:hypothetical protein